MMTRLLLLIFVSCASATKPSLDDSVMEITCLGKYTGIFHSFIYFAEANSTDYYTIRTPWLLTYPSRIKSKLSNVTIFDNNPVSKCSWTTLAHVKNMAVSTGTIYRYGAENKRVQDTALNVLSTTYPSLEMALLVVGCFLALVAVIAIGVFWKS